MMNSYRNNGNKPHRNESGRRPQSSHSSEKLDLKRKYFELFDATTKDVQFLPVPAFQFLIVEGDGNPNTSELFQQAVEALYAVSFYLKFGMKDRLDYVVMPLEALWWTDDMNDFSIERKEDWKWTVMIHQPDFISIRFFQDALIDVAKKKDLPALKRMKFEKWEEGFCAQILHKGPYAAEAPTIERLHEAITAKGYEKVGRHHELYLGDPRRSAPEKLKTIIRQPIKQV